MNKILKNKWRIALLLTGLAVATLAVFYLVSSEMSIISNKKGFSAAWGVNSNTLFYFAEENPKELSVRKITAFPWKRDQKIPLGFTPARIAWLCDYQALLASPGLDYQKGHYVKLNLVNLEQENFYIPSANGIFYFSPNCKEVLTVNSIAGQKTYLSRYSLDRKEITQFVSLNEELTHVSNVLWFKDQEVILSISDPGLPIDQAHYLLDLQTKVAKKLSDYTDYLINPKPYQNKILFASYDGLILYNRDDDSRSTISEIVASPAYGISYSWINENNFVYFEIAKADEMYLYLFDLEKGTKHILAEFKARANYITAPDLYVSPDKRKVAFQNPEGYLQLVKIK